MKALLICIGLTIAMGCMVSTGVQPEKVQFEDNSEVVITVRQIPNFHLQTLNGDIDVEHTGNNINQYVHYLVTVSAPLDLMQFDPNYLDFRFKDELTLECDTESENPSFYIHEGQVPGENGKHRILTAFKTHVCRAPSQHKLVVNSPVFGFMQLSVSH